MSSIIQPVAFGDLAEDKGKARMDLPSPPPSRLLSHVHQVDVLLSPLWVRPRKSGSGQVFQEQCHPGVSDSAALRREEQPEEPSATGSAMPAGTGWQEFH